MRRRIGSVAFAIGVSAALSCTAIHTDELLCEEAAAHVQECCPGVEIARINCDYDTGSCVGTTHEPDLRGDVAKCLRDTACGELTKVGGACDKVRQASLTPEFLGTRNAFAGTCP